MAEPSAAATAARRTQVHAPSEAKLLELRRAAVLRLSRFHPRPDAILADFGFGRAHHRVLHFVNRHSGLRVADLLDMLKITKQSLGRVLKQLIDKGYIVQRAGSVDRRERCSIQLTAGRALAERLAAPQLVRLAAALQAAGPGAEADRAPLPAKPWSTPKNGPKSPPSWPHRQLPLKEGGKGGGVMTMPTPIKAASRQRRPTTMRRISSWSTTTAASATCSPAICRSNGFRVTTAVDAATARAPACAASPSTCSSST